ncbi:hypothetical protein PPYR_05769 [Photinus pyralis]|uniref:Carboxylesterase type B domain-containing protein n=2 Tax=Photinus pyralis TaxID=7054 RepID=A0A5N4AVM1_PHOPY|nr:hypothetical protein PPYR_05769 [Photinus pyralis]
MACGQQPQLFSLCLVLITYSDFYVTAQNGYYGPYYQQNKPNENYRPPEPGDRDYRTFVYKGRRYGQYQPNNFDWQGAPGDPQRVGQDARFRYDPVGNAEPILPGILGGWREDLQGKRRPDTIYKDMNVFVKTKHGEVQGFKVFLYDTPDPDSLYRPGSESIEREQGYTVSFLGIPYALPPVDEGRFKPPRWHKGWQLMQATDFGPACPQPVRYVGASKGVRDMDEDCLYLNIFTPSIGGVSLNFPVMVYIHGGDFMHGASNTFPGHIMVTFFKVVVVTINYRLGALGFLSTGDINSPGNYGILDQSMALRWVYENIEFFNGDKNSITLFGPGAGAASAGLLMVAPDTKHIINKVIAQSGSAVADWAFIVDKYRAQNTSRVFGQLLGCSIDSSWKLINCLKQGRSALELGNAEFPPEIGLFPWGPVAEMNVTMPYYEGWYEKDWHFIDDTPENLIKSRRFNPDLKYMSSVTIKEASDFIYKNESLAPFFEIGQQFVDQKIREFVLRFNYTLNPNGTYDAIKYMYTYWPDPNNRTFIREQYINMLSDFLYVAPNDKMIKLLVERNVPVYMYLLNTTVESFNYPEWRKVPHDIEHYLLCGAPFMDVEFFSEKEHFTRNQWTNNDRNMSYFFMRAYTDFARHGNPSHTQILGIHFESATNGQLKYLNLNTTFNSSIMWNYRQTESAFWTQYLPKVVGHLVPTYPPTTEFWWEPRAPLQIAFWSMSAVCLILVVLLVMCCMLWRNAKRQSDRYYNGDLFLGNEVDHDVGIENARSQDIYEYTDKPKTPAFSESVHAVSSPSIRTESAVSLKDMGDSRKPTPVTPSLKYSRSKTQLIEGVPQTDV